MRCRCIVIIDLDEVYLQRIFESISNYQENKFSVVTFSDINLAKIFIEENRVDLVLIDESFIYENEIYLDGKMLILSNENKDGYLNKYGNVSELISHLYEILEEKEEYDESDNDKKEFDLISVFSFLEVGYKNAYAMAISQNYSSFGEVLYINLDEFAALGKAFKSDGGSNFSDIVYEFRKNGSLKSENVMEAIGKLGDFYFIEPSICVNDISKLEAKELYKIIENIVSALNFDYVVVEIGSMCLVPWDLYEKSDEIHIPYKKTVSYKMVEFNNYLSNLGKDNIFNRMITKELKEELKPYNGYGFCDDNLDMWCSVIKNTKEE